MTADPALVHRLAAAVQAGRARMARQPFVLGLCGAQGSGKSTLAAALAATLTADGAPTAILSLDDLYKTRASREAMAARIHPLFRTRGVPGTHDLALGREVIDGLATGRATPLPRFDKATDDRIAVAAWPHAPAGTAVLLLEGWCVGARPQAEEALAVPVNALEREEDGDGRWRRHANRALRRYQRLFARIDLLVLLAAPGFEVVRGWRTEQERALRAVTGGGMSDEEVGRFIAHYERLTRHILDEMPARADLTIPLDRDRMPLG